MVKGLLFGLLCLISITAYSQTNYYVKNGGSDSNTGLSDAQAWETLGKADDVIFTPGDTLFIARGSIFKEEFKPRGDGDATAQVVITAYGTGAKPIISARDTVDGWSGAGNWSRPWEVEYPNVWYNDEARTPLYYVAMRMWFDGSEVDRPEDFPPTAAHPYYWYGDDSLFVYSTTNPATAFSNMEKSTALYNGIDLDGDNYFTFSYLDLQHQYMCIEVENSDGIIIDSCDFTGYFGVNAYADPGLDSRDCIIRNCNFTTGVEYETGWESKQTEDGIHIGSNCINWDIHDNYFSDWGHSSIVLQSLYTDGRRIDSIEIYDNYITAPNIDYGGRIAADYYSGIGNKYYRNHIHDISIANQFNGENLEVYYNVINGVHSPTWRLGYGTGISVQGYSTNTKPEGMKFYNNVITDCDDYGISVTHYTGRAHKTGNEFINNIIYDCSDGALRIYNNATDTGIYNNVYRNNLFYNSGTDDVVNYWEVAMTVDEFNDKNGTEDDVILSNIGGDPDFDGTTFELLSTSPAINAGIDVGLTTDYAGTAVPQGIYFDIGAYEFEAFPVATTGLGWENHYAKKNFKDDVNFEKGFSVDGVPINFTTNVTYLLRLSPTASPPVSPTEGTIYMDTDHHLYLYNGSAWVQLDN